MTEKQRAHVEGPMTAKARVFPYIEDAVERQGFPRMSASWAQRCDWMWEAWSYAMERRLQQFTKEDILRLGHLVERGNDGHDFRHVAVTAGGNVKLHWPLIERAIDNLVERQTALDPASLYKEFEEIHPFVDGNGRVGEIIYSWRRGTLRDPVRPPDFWSTEPGSGAR